MATLTEIDRVKVATEAAETFVDSFYSALEGARGSIKTFYVPTSMPANGRGLPNITYNGDSILDSTVFQEKWEKEMPRVSFDAQSVNAHVLNPTLNPLVDGQNKKKDAERNMSIIVQVSGVVRLGTPKEGPLHGFSDSFVLVPNTEQTGGAGTGKQDEGRRWLIQNQAFRFVT